MRKFSLISFMMLIVSTSTFAGGLLTNTNQHAAFLRMLSRGATTEIDGALSNPAGLAFLPNDGFHMSLSIQSAFQTRNIDASCEGLGLNKYYEGKAVCLLLIRWVTGRSPAFSVLPVAEERLRLTTVFLCSMLW